MGVRSGKLLLPYHPKGALFEGADQVEEKEVVVDQVDSTFQRRKKLKNYFNGVGAIPAQWGVVHPFQKCNVL